MTGQGVPSEDREYDLRLREIALREAVKRAREVEGGSPLLIAMHFEHFLRTGRSS